jgi:hypothetical protein
MISSTQHPKVDNKSKQASVTHRKEKQVQVSVNKVKIKMGKGGKCLQNANQEIKELQDSLHELDNWVIDLHKQIDLKDKLIEALQLKLIEKEQQIENMVDATCATNDLIQKVNATCDTNDLMQMVDVTCDTHDLMVDTKATKDMVDDSLTSHEMESYNELMKISLVEDESQEEARSDTKSSINEM